MTSRAEIERLKASADLVAYACRRHNYAVDLEESSPRGNPTHWVLRRADGRKLVAMRTRACWIYYDLKLYGEELGAAASIRGEGHGTIIDFIQEELRLPKGSGTPGFGLALRELRDFVGAAPVAAPTAGVPPAADRNAGASRRPSADVLTTWRAAEAATTSRYLASRGLMTATLNSELFRGTWRVDRRDNVLFPHHDASGQLTGFDIKNRGISLFSKGGVKTGVWRSNPMPARQASHYLLTEATINNLSFQQLHPAMACDHRAFGGRIGVEQLRLVAAELRALERSTTVLLGFDGNGDPAGRFYERQLREIMPAWLRAERAHPPHGKDWNDFLQMRDQGMER